MTRLIDADVFEKNLENEWKLQEISNNDLIQIREWLAQEQTVDAVPVIRCKDCKHHYYHEMLKQDYCEIPNIQFGEVEPNGYCHRAERREKKNDTVD